MGKGILKLQAFRQMCCNIGICALVICARSAPYFSSGSSSWKWHFSTNFVIFFMPVAHRDKALLVDKTRQLRLKWLFYTCNLRIYWLVVIKSCIHQPGGTFKMAIAAGDRSACLPTDHYHCA